VTPDLITVCVDRSNPPYVEELNGELHGLSCELVRRAFSHEGVEVQLLAANGPLEQAIFLATGRAEVAADLTITERRLRWFRFSHPYLVEELQVLMRRHGRLWSGLERFEGIVGVKADSYAQEYLIRHHPRLRLLPLDTTERLLEAVLDDRAQAAVLSRVTDLALTAHGRHPGLELRGAPFAPAPLALAALPEQAVVLEVFNRGLAAVGGGWEYLRLIEAAAS